MYTDPHDMQQMLSTFQDVVREEWEEIRVRRQNQRHTGFATDTDVPPKDVVGLALSGGGIRSATFCLGLLQGMHSCGVLRMFDYLSTVSGGGYVGGWWSAWLTRDNVDRQTMPADLRLKVEDLHKPAMLAAELYTHRFQPTLSAYLYRMFSPQTQKLLKRYNDKHGVPSEELKGSLVNELNRLIEHPTLYSEAPFNSVRLTDSTQSLLSELMKDGALYEAHPRDGRYMQLNRLLLEEAYPYEFGRSIFPTSEGIEPERYKDDSAGKVAESSLNAGSDPIHHLRLFGNYITPRKGLLSADTWRAISVVTRNLLLTWMILVPVLIAVILAGQFYFILEPDSAKHFFYSYICVEKGWTDAPMNFLFDSDHLAVLYDRMLFAAWPVVALIGWIAVMTTAWMQSIRDRSSTMKGLIIAGSAIVGLVIVIVLTILIVWLYQQVTADVSGLVGWLPVDLRLANVPSWLVSEHLWLVVGFGGGWLVIALALLIYALRPVEQADDPETAEFWRQEVVRNQIVRVHATLMVTLAIIIAVLGIAGFGFEALYYLLYVRGSGITDYITKIGGWGTLVLSLAGSIFTALKASPTGGGDKHVEQNSSPQSRLIFAITPPLVLIVLAMMAGLIGNVLLKYLFDRAAVGLPLLTVISFIGIAISFIFAGYEIGWSQNSASRRWLLWWIATTVAVIGGLACILLNDRSIEPSQRMWVWVVALVVGCLLAFRAVLMEEPEKSANVRRTFKFKGFLKWAPASRPPMLLIAGLAALGAAAVGVAVNILLNEVSHRPAGVELIGVVLIGIALCMLFIGIEAAWGRGDNRRTIWLLTGIYAALAVFLIFNSIPDYADHQRLLLAHILAGLITALLGLVVILGWMADPNAISLHTFYKARLIRAYLGASNPRRGRQSKQITEAVAGDDELLKGLQNCTRGAPYHLVNTTLNLVGGRDLATAQRSSASFILSKGCCGSLRTGYRNTAAYMQGSLSLGTAVAVSGAAASPNMGAKTPTSALAMLMTLFNVRLGYWAPTPNQEHWQSPQARLWPYYMLCEFLSQTNDLQSYCYLTDGGHFDNTGLYSLVERGCRYIVVADCGADSTPCFGDLGDAIRRCRIDFEAEIDIDISPLIPPEGKKTASVHFVAGTIMYSKKHLKKLGRSGDTSANGIIIVIKPTLVTKGDESVDVRQYGIENSDFPQQTTADQFFDEAQFESYRELGYESGAKAFRGLDGVDVIGGDGAFGRKHVRQLFESAPKCYGTLQGSA